MIPSNSRKRGQFPWMNSNPRKRGQFSWRKALFCMQAPSVNSSATSDTDPQGSEARFRAVLSAVTKIQQAYRRHTTTKRYESFRARLSATKKIQQAYHRHTTKRSEKVYDVFLSFRGEDSRAKFISHLYASLQNAGIYVFRDNDEIQRGDMVLDSLKLAISKSRISIVVLSKRYANSKWCMRELHDIMKHRKTTSLVVVPVFYEVDPSDVRHQTGEFGKAFENLITKISGDEQDSVRNWRTALLEVGGMAGVVIINSRNESEDILKVVEDVTDLLGKTDLFVAQHPVGKMSPLEFGLLPNDNYPEWLTFNSECSYVIFKVPQVDGRNLRAIMCIVYSSSPDEITSEGLKNVMLINYTKNTIQLYKKDALDSFDEEEWQKVVSNIEPGNKVKVVVVFENGFAVKNTTVYLIYDEPIDKKAEHYLEPDKNVVASGGDENRFGRHFFMLLSLVRALLISQPFWFLLAGFLIGSLLFSPTKE